MKRIIAFAALLALAAACTGPKPSATKTTSEPVKLGIIAQRVGASIAVNPVSGELVNPSPEASALFTRDYEPGWEL